MDDAYRVYPRKRDIGRRINQLHQEEPLAVGILDIGTQQELVSCIDWYVLNFNSCLHVITVEGNDDIEQWRLRWPDVTWIAFKNHTLLAEKLGALADECYTTYFMVVRSDMELVHYDRNLLARHAGRQPVPAVLSPLLYNSQDELLPTLSAPCLEKKNMASLSFFPRKGKLSSQENFVPFLGLGMYERALFQRMRGFDSQIISDYWQCYDFAGRTWLCGYPFYVTPSFAFRFSTRISVVEERTEPLGINRMYTKLLGVQQIKGKNFLNPRMSRVEKDVLEDEVRTRLLLLYKQDFSMLVQGWKAPEEDSV